VRIGFGKISENYPGGEIGTRLPFSRDYFERDRFVGGGLRTATCTALDHVELVRVSGNDFRQMMERFPERPQRLEAVAAERLAANRSACRWPQRPHRSISLARIDGGAELADSGLAKLHALRRLCEMLALMRTTESPPHPRWLFASINILSPPVAGNAAIRSAWSAAPSARFEGAIRSKIIIEDW